MEMLIQQARPSPESMVFFVTRLGQEFPTLAEGDNFTDMADDQQ